MAPRTRPWSYDWNMAKGWIAATATGEAIGIAGVAFGYALADRGLAPATFAILLAGAWEGLCLGTAQSRVLSRYGIRPVRWIGITITLAVLGYAGALAGGPGGAEAESETAEISWVVAVGGAAALGAFMGVVMGAGQAWVASGILNRKRWILRSARGWALAMPAIFIGASLVQSDWSLMAVVLTGMGAGACAGALLGMATAGATPD